MFVEMTGRASWEPPETGLELLTRAQLPPHLRHAPTRIEVIVYIFISTSRYLST